MSAVPIASPIRTPKRFVPPHSSDPHPGEGPSADPVEKHDPAKDIRRRRSEKLDKRLTSTRRIEKDDRAGARQLRHRMPRSAGSPAPPPDIAASRQASNGHGQERHRRDLLGSGLRQQDNARTRAGWSSTSRWFDCWIGSRGPGKSCEWQPRPGHAASGGLCGAARVRADGVEARRHRPVVDVHSCPGQGTAGTDASLVEDHGRSPARLARRSRAGRSTRGVRQRRGVPLSRWGFAYLLKQHAATAARAHPGLDKKRILPHGHTCAMIILQATHDIVRCRCGWGTPL